MTVLTASELSLSFGSRTLFEDLSFTIADGDRIGLIGRNGSGKTTLMRILAGQQEIDGGNISVADGARVGYLDQNLAEGDDPRTLIDFVVESIPARNELEDRIAQIEVELQTCEDAEAAMAMAQELTDGLERLDRLETEFAPHHAHAILKGLGFKEKQTTEPVDILSGGWRMRAHLAALLFSRPHLLLLDEPTNHLDVPTVAWFSEFLVKYSGAFALISHDRDFINTQVNRVVAIEKERTRVYTGNYDDYAAARAEEEQILHARAKNIAKQKEDMQRFIDRFRAQANKAKAVQSRVKALEKMEDVVLLTAEDNVRIRIPAADKPVSTVLRGSDVTHDYGNGPLFSQLSIALQRGDKVALIGENGAGKTTLLRILAQELTPSEGDVSFGNRVKPGYYAQHHTKTLELERTIYEEVGSANREASQTAVRTVLGSLLFSGDDVEKQISVLSGGERARVCLAKLIIQPTNLLMMDEPTNHLDLESSEALAQALKEYEGSVLFVSHNMALIRTVATRVWNLSEGRFEDYPGSYVDYEYRLAQRKKAAETVNEKKPATGQASKGKKSSGKKKSKQLSANGLRDLRRDVEALETEITTLEQQVATLSEELTAVELDHSERAALAKRLQGAQEAIERATKQWEEKSLTLADAEEV